MIRTLRRRHALLTVALLVLLAPVGLLAGLLARPDEVVMTGLPRSVFPELALPSGRVAKAALTVDGVPIAVRTWGAGRERFLQLAPEADLRQPDVLVYWTAGTVADPDAPPPNEAVLVGSFGGALPRSYALPPAAAQETGSVVLYSLAHKRGLGSAVLAADG